MDPDELIARMDARASSLSGEYVSDPGMVALDRDRPREVREEAEDLLNHAIWWLEDNPEHPLALHRFESLRLLIQVYSVWSTED